MFSENLKKLRLLSGLNKKQAAILLNLPYTTYNNYETGSREPNSEVLVKIANAFSVSTDYLLDNLSFDGENMLLTTEEREIVKKYRDLPGGIQNAVKQMVETTHRCWQEKSRKDEEDGSSQTGIDMESPTTLYHNSLSHRPVDQNIVVAAYGDGVHTHTCPAGKQTALQKAQEALQIDLEIAKRREKYGK